MVNVQTIVEKLNSDPQALAKFPADPVGYLASEGLELSEAAKKQLMAHVKMKQSAKPAWRDMCEFGNRY